MVIRILTNLSHFTTLKQLPGGSYLSKNPEMLIEGGHKLRTWLGDGERQGKTRKMVALCGGKRERCKCPISGPAPSNDRDLGSPLLVDLVGEKFSIPSWLLSRIKKSQSQKG